MKFFKLFIIFILVLGAIIGAFFIKDCTGTTKLPPPTDETYQTYRNQFEKDWEQKGDWDKDLYLEHCDLVNQLSTTYETGTLQDLSTKTASEIVYNKIFEEWNRPGCSKKVINNYRDAVNVIMENDGNAKSDPNIKKILEVFSTYTDADAFAHQSIGKRPTFSNDEWTPFSSYSKGIESRRSGVLNNANYKSYLSNINDIKNGLNAIPGKLRDSRENFYSVLASQIVSTYSAIPEEERTRDDLKRLRNVNSRYVKECKSEGVTGDPGSSLTKFVNAFSESVDRNESDSPAP